MNDLIFNEPPGSSSLEFGRDISVNEIASFTSIANATRILFVEIAESALASDTSVTIVSVLANTTEISNPLDIVETASAIKIANRNEIAIMRSTTSGASLLPTNIQESIFASATVNRENTLNVEITETGIANQTQDSIASVVSYITETSTAIANQLSNKITNVNAFAQAIAGDISNFVKPKIAIGDSFNPFFNIFCVHNSDVVIPPHFLRYDPQPEDPSCGFVIAVSPQNGATSWTKNGRWITIGVYKDTGRKPATSPLYNTTFTRDDLRLTLVTQQDNIKLQIGDKVEILDIDINPIKGEIIDRTNNSITINTTNSGSTSGTCRYRIVDYDFPERYSVFRLLPDYRLLTKFQLEQIFNETSIDRPNYWWLVTNKPQLQIPASSPPPVPSTQEYISAVMEDSPVFYWYLDETSGLIVNDYSGNSNNGLYPINASTTTTSGLLAGNPIRNRGWNSIGTPSNKIGITQIVAAVPQHTSWTFESIINVAGAPLLGSINTIFQYGPDLNTGSDVRLPELNVIDDTGGRYRYRVMISNVEQVFVTSDSWNYGETHHLVLQYNSNISTCLLWINGILVDGSANVNFTNIPKSFYIGYSKFVTSDTYPFYGVIDEVAMYDYVLSSDRILAHSNIALGI